MCGRECEHACVHVWVWGVWTGVRACMYVHACRCVCVSVCVYTCLRACTCVRVCVCATHASLQCELGGSRWGRIEEHELRRNNATEPIQRAAPRVMHMRPTMRRLLHGVRRGACHAAHAPLMRRTGCAARTAHSAACDCAMAQPQCAPAARRHSREGFERGSALGYSAQPHTGPQGSQE